jgi:flagellar biosynthesis/type III secretory pathway chaperone
MTSTANSSDPQLHDLQLRLEDLQKLLQAEFQALKKQDLDALDRLVVTKEQIVSQLGDKSMESLIDDAAGAAKSAGDGESAAQWRTLTGLASTCRNMQKRNEILIDRKLAVVRTALSSLVAPADAGVQTYNRQGRMTSSGNGPGGVL